MTRALMERIDGAKMIDVIEVILVRGEGTQQDPLRKVLQYYDKNGNLLAENDIKPN